MGKVNQIETEIWVNNPEKPGYLMLERKKTLNEVFKELVQVLREHGVYEELDYFHVTVGEDKNRDFPDFHKIACFAVEGGSEGHYIHIAVITATGTDTIFLGKTFCGIEHALNVSNISTKAFYR
jgi:hypothetical protein